MEWLFLLFWIWVIVLGFKGVASRLRQLRLWLSTPWSSNDDLFPTLRGTVGQAWSADEHRHYSSLAARTAVPAIPEITREMEEALDDERRTAQQISRDIAEWQAAIAELNRAVADWTDKAALALSKGRNDLGRAAIAERQRTQKRISELESDVAEMRQLLTTHASDIQSLETKLSTVYRRSHLVERRLTAAEASTRARQMLYGEQVKDALARFEALERAADQAEGHAESLALGSDASLDQLAIDAELAGLRGAPAFGRKRLAS